nr:MFS transporter [uncultured Dyadobacter sp.]
MTKRNAGYKWQLLALLWLAFFLNQADRQIFSIVLPLIRQDLGLSDEQLGLIASVLVWTYGIMVPVAGFWGDRFSRKKIIGFSLIFWSIATLSTGLCTTLLQFILLRGIATGGGEAFYAPSANALISEHHQETRSFALSVHQSANYLGIILSGLIAGYIGETYGWQKAFYLFGAFGIIVGMLVFMQLRNDIPVPVQEKPDILKTAGVIFRKPTVLLLTLGFACMVFVNVGYLTWMPSFIAAKFSLSLSAAGFNSMFYHHGGAVIGVLAGGKLADRLSLSDRKARLMLQGISLLLAAPFIFWMAAAGSEPVTYLALFIFGLFRGAYDSNIFASLYEVVPAGLRSSASGLMLMCAFLAGAFSPYLLGALKPTLGLSLGLSLLSVAYILGGAFIIVGALLFFKRDQVQFQ